jgi:hypothetical protein
MALLRKISYDETWNALLITMEGVERFLVKGLRPILESNTVGVPFPTRGDPE